MKKIILFLILILILASGCTERPTQFEQVEPKIPVEWCIENASTCGPNERDDPEGKICKNACFIRSALQFNETSTCERIDVQSGDVSKDECYVKLAKKLNNLDLCENVVKEIGRNSKDHCLQEIAILRNDASICESMKLESEYKVFKSSKEIGGNHFSRDVCFYVIGVAINNVDLCKKVSLNAEGHQKNRGSRKACITWIAANLNDINVCDNMEREVRFVDRDACIISTAVFNNKPELCENVEEARYAYASRIVQHTKDECYFRVGSANNELDTCNKMSDKEGFYTKKSCIESVKKNLEYYDNAKPGEPTSDIHLQSQMW